MEKPNYKQIKQIHNLPKYEFGKMSSVSATGYQPGDTNVNTGYVENSGADMQPTIDAQRSANTMQAVSKSAELASNIGNTVAPSIALMAGVEGATKAGAAAAGYSGGALSIATGGLGIYSGASQLHNTINDSDIQQLTGRQVNYGINNRPYRTVSFNQQQAKQLSDARMRSATDQGIIGTVGAGSGVGSIVGTAIAPGLGTVIGTGAGALLGAIGGVLGFNLAGDSISNDMDERFSNLSSAYSRYNKQQQSIANSLGMQDEFNARRSNTVGNSGLYRGKRGIKPGTTLKNTGAPQLVNTAFGVAYGKPNAITNGNEGIFNPVTGAYSRVMGDSKENKASVVNKEDAVIKEEDRPMFEAAMSIGDYNTMNNIMNNQGSRKKKKLPSYNDGLMPVGAMLGSYLANMGSLLYQDTQDRSQRISRYKTHIPNRASILYANQARPYKDFSPIQALNDELSRSMYYTRHGGAMTAGQRMGMQNALLTGNANAKANMYNTINSNYYNQMNDYGKTLASIVDQDNARQLASNQQELQAKTEYDRKVSIMNNNLRYNRATRMQNTNDLAKNFTQLWQFNKNVDLWNRKLNNDAKSLV